ncbi:MAG: radical SAM protein [Chryseolinea sp.]
MLARLLNFATDRIHELPVLVLMPHSRCNCRCVMCDIWKANHNKKEITVEELQKHIAAFESLGVKEIVFSGGEALMHSNLWRLCQMLRDRKIKLTLLSTGLLLERNVLKILEYFNEVIISIDGSQPVHDKIRNIPNGFEKLSAGVRALKLHSLSFRITARCVLQKLNYFDFPNVVKEVKNIGIDQISFLAADVSTGAFNHESIMPDESVSQIALSSAECDSFETILESSFIELKSEYASLFIAEQPDKMRRLVQYYRAINGTTSFPRVVCNAPWVSAVLESDGRLMPCFFHEPYGSIYENTFNDVLNSSKAILFRKKLNVSRDPVCQKCVCSLKLPRI